MMLLIMVFICDHLWFLLDYSYIILSNFTNYFLCVVGKEAYRHNPYYDVLGHIMIYIYVLIFDIDANNGYDYMDYT